jgi:hypothetical protein
VMMFTSPRKRGEVQPGLAPDYLDSRIDRT